MIEQLTVDEIYARAGFTEMAYEYGRISDPLFPKPTIRKEDYLPLEKAGLLAVYGATRGGKLVGIATCVKGKIPHYGVSIAIVESLYLMREHRASGLGLRLLEACEDQARIWALPHIFIQVHEEEIEVLGKVLQRRKYSERIHTFGRLL